LADSVTRQLLENSHYIYKHKKNPPGADIFSVHDRELYREPHVKQLLVEQLEVLQLPPRPAGDEVPAAENIEISLKVRSDPHFGQGATSLAFFTSSSYL